MTAATGTTDLAARTRIAVRRAADYIADRIATARDGSDGDWRNPDVRAAFLRALDGITVYSPGPGRVVATIADTHHGRLWHYVAHDALRAACPADGEVRQVAATMYHLIIRP
jgi:hypothetical protein